MIGQTISRYKILGKLGSGGMGDVYKAEDTKLGRHVALKFLASHLVSDGELRKRFEREAKAAASLNHPNICHVYEIDQANGKLFLAMELIEGESVEAKVERGPLKLADVYDIGRQTAEGLQAAHEKGVVHRDIKPGNILVTNDGRVKILDFGLALLTEASKLTQLNTTVGTVAYMSPEQAQGVEVDSRTDIWALGCVLYEMASGQRPFLGHYDQAIVYSIINEDPEPLTALRTGVPMELESIVGKCLAKDPADRYSIATEIATDLRALRASGRSRVAPRSVSASPAAEAQSPVPDSKAALPWTLAALGLCASAALAFIHFTEQPTSSIPQWNIRPLTAYTGVEARPALSPDGEQVAFMWNKQDGSGTDLYVRLVDGGRPLQLTSDRKPEGYAAWSPDAKTIAFTRNDGVYAVPALGGSERRIARLDTAAGLDWSPDGRWLAVSAQGGLRLLEVETGRIVEATDPSYPDRWPAYSPDGRTLAFVRGSTGFLGGAVTMPLDGSGEPAGEPREATRTAWAFGGLAWWPDGRRLVFSATLGQRRLLLRAPADGSAEPETLPIESEDGSQPSISARSGRLAYSRGNLQNAHLWKADLQSGEPPQRLLRLTRSNYSPAISPDGSRLVYMSVETGFSEVWRVNSDGSDPLQLTHIQGNQPGSPRWSPDGEWIVFDAYIEGSSDLFRVRSEGGEVEPILSGSHNDTRPRYSHDGEWIYFGSDRTGQVELWRMLAAGGGDLQQVASGGARDARPDIHGSFLYFARGGGVWRRPLDQDVADSSRDELIHQGDGSAGADDWAVGRRNLYAVVNSERRIVAVDLETKAVRELMPFRDDWVRAGGGPQVAVDYNERFLVFAMDERAESDLILVENLE